MIRKRADEPDNPLSDILASLPEEPPPADLEARCLRVVREPQPAAREQRRAPVSFGLRAAAAVVAVFVLVVGLVSLPATGLLPSGQGQRAPKPLPRLVAPGAWSRAAPAPAPPPGATSKLGAPATQPPEALPEQRRTQGAAESATRTMRVPSGGPDFSEAEIPEGLPGTEALPLKPWRDTSGELQKVTSKTMEVQVNDLEEAYDRAVSIIQKAKGVIVNEEMRLREGGKSQAHILARVPVESVDGVVAQLRDLGKVVRLVGESEDRTREYYGRGAEIREAGAKEEELVAKYEQEKDPARKRALYQEIMTLRALNRDQKTALQRLSERTHYATIDLTLTQCLGPREFLARVWENTRLACAWVVATAVLWGPLLLIVLLVWRRRQ